MPNMLNKTLEYALYLKNSEYNKTLNREHWPPVEFTMSEIIAEINAMNNYQLLEFISNAMEEDRWAMR